MIPTVHFPSMGPEKETRWDLPENLWTKSLYNSFPKINS